MRLERAADGAAIGLGRIRIDNADRAAMRADVLEPLEAGRYLVSWQNLSADDGDDDSGTYPFYVGRGPTEAEQAADREIARDLLIPYPGDEADAAEGDAVEARAPTVLRSEAEPTGGLAIGAALWLAVGAVAFVGLSARPGSFAAGRRDAPRDPRTAADRDRGRRVRRRAGSPRADARARDRGVHDRRRPLAAGGWRGAAARRAGRGAAGARARALARRRADRLRALPADRRSRPQRRGRPDDRRRERRGEHGARA